MQEFFESINLDQVFTETFLWSLLKSAIYVLAGFLLSRLLLLIIRGITKNRLTQQSSMLLKKTVNYIFSTIIFFIILAEFKVDLTTILGAAGVLGIAIGVASKNSIGNIISGFFLIGERPFEVGDTIRVGETLGVIHSIDLLSVKIRTFQNLFVRIPNETIINTEVINVTRFPIRRLDFEFAVPITEDIEKIRTVLVELSKQNRLCLIEPEPLFVVKSMGEKGIEFLFGLWFEKSNFIALKNSFAIDVQKAFKENNIDFALPRMRIFHGNVSTLPDSEQEINDQETEAAGPQKQ